MKKSFILAAAGAMLFGGVAFAQEKSTMFNGSTNLQAFYDFGRECITSTLEGFYNDPWGNTFFFIDYDYQLTSDNGTTDSPGSTYFEIARCFNFWQNSALGAFSLQLEYNGGFGTWGTPTVGGFYNVNHAILAGGDYFIHSADFSNTHNLKVLYKNFTNMAQDVPMQFTAVWGLQDLFGAKGLRYSGFVDVWWEGSNCVVLSEPQLWYAVGQHFGCPNLNIGGEIELSANFAGTEGFACRPCAGLKWVF